MSRAVVDNFKNTPPVKSTISERNPIKFGKLNKSF